MKLCLLIFLILTFFSCSFKNEGLKKNWLNLEYVSCLKQRLPCECLNGIEISAIIFDSDQDSMNTYVYEKNMDYGLWKVIRHNDRFRVYEAQSPLVPQGDINISRDTLTFFNKAGIKQVFINYPEFESSGYDSYLGRVNAFLVNQSFNRKGHKLFDILPSGPYEIYCNYEAGEINLISVSGECDNKWILEQKNGSVSVYKYVNSCDGKRIQPSIVKELYRKYKW